MTGHRGGRLAGTARASMVTRGEVEAYLHKYVTVDRLADMPSLNHALVASWCAMVGASDYSAGFRCGTFMVDLWGMANRDGWAVVLEQCKQTRKRKAHVSAIKAPDWIASLRLDGRLKQACRFLIVDGDDIHECGALGRGQYCDTHRARVTPKQGRNLLTSSSPIGDRF